MKSVFLLLLVFLTSTAQGSTALYNVVECESPLKTIVHLFHDKHFSWSHENEKGNLVISGNSLTREKIMTEKLSQCSDRYYQITLGSAEQKAVSYSGGHITHKVTLEYAYDVAGNLIQVQKVTKLESPKQGSKAVLGITNYSLPRSWNSLNYVGGFNKTITCGSGSQIYHKLSSKQAIEALSFYFQGSRFDDKLNHNVATRDKVSSSRCIFLSPKEE